MCERQNRFPVGGAGSTVRVGVHQGEDRDVQRVPQLPHHQPAVHVGHAFPLTHTNTLSPTLDSSAALQADMRHADD